MRFNPIPLMAALLLFSLSLAAQPDSRYSLLLKSGTITPQKNITATSIDELNSRMAKSGGQMLVILQFEVLPADAQVEQLKNAGITLLDYVPHNAYTAVVS
ncbi:MAG: hypothetical protein JNM19_03275, partial [Chitinophagaceae bacterium]|nr:hypothetical protein [Chitinophagaceae bacterium]